MLENLVGEKKLYTHWQWYKAYFDITIFRYLVMWFAIVPSLAMLLGEIPKELQFKDNSGEPFTLVLDLPFTWQFLWIASLLFLVAYCVYQYHCPRFIKTYNSLSDYRSHLHSPRWISWISLDITKDSLELPKFFSRLNTKGYLDEVEEEITDTLPIVIVKQSQTVLLFNYNDKNYSLGMPRLKDNAVDKDATDRAESELFWEVFGRYSTTGAKARLLILILLSLSALFFSIALIQNILAGLTYFWVTLPS